MSATTLSKQPRRLTPASYDGLRLALRAQQLDTGAVTRHLRAIPIAGRGIKIGKAGSLRGRWCGATGDKGEVRWYRWMQELSDPDNNHRIFTSPYCFDAHMFGPDDFEIFVLEKDIPTKDMPCRERAWMDALKRDPNWVDYNWETPA